MSKERNTSQPTSEKWLESTNDLDKVVEESYQKPVAIFKHSSRCGISRVVLNRTISNWEVVNDDADIYFLDLLRFRSLSNYISESFKVEHQSPQLILIKNGEHIFNCSHNSIEIGKIKDQIDNA